VTREEARKLLSGYATGSLTELEQQLLFDAALDDQELFDELAEEQAVRELVELPGAKRRLLLALGPVRKQAVWWPWATGVAVAAALAVAVTVWVQRPAVELRETAEVQTVPLVLPVAPPPAPSAAAPNTPVPEAAGKAAGALDSSEPEVATAEAAKDADAAAAPQAKTLAFSDRANAVTRDEIAPVPNQLETRAAQGLPSLALPTLPQPAARPPAPLGIQALRAEATRPPAAAPKLFSAAPAAVAAIAARGELRYEVRDTGILRMTPTRSGVLEVTFDGRPLYPAQSVVAGTAIDVSVPLEAKQLRIDFAGQTSAPAVAAQNGEASGTLVLPAGPNARAVVTIPAQR
jgi:hypothetical protein